MFTPLRACQSESGISGAGRRQQSGLSLTRSRAGHILPLMCGRNSTLAIKTPYLKLKDGGDGGVRRRHAGSGEETNVRYSLVHCIPRNIGPDGIETGRRNAPSMAGKAVIMACPRVRKRYCILFEVRRDDVPHYPARNVLYLEEVVNLIPPQRGSYRISKSPLWR